MGRKSTQIRSDVGQVSAASLVVIVRYRGINLTEDDAEPLLPDFEAMLERVRRVDAAATRGTLPAHVGRRWSRRFSV